MKKKLMTLILHKGDRTYLWMNVKSFDIVNQSINFVTNSLSFGYNDIERVDVSYESDNK